MEIQERKVADIILLDLSGRIDAFTSEKLEEELNSIINTGKRKFIINFDKVTYISSSGLRVFLGAYKKLSDHKGAIRFSNMQDTVLKVFALAGFDKIFDIYSTETEAMNGFKGELNESRA
ncbi:MAG: hypothetical protein A2Z91_07185 [Deltaproteobacteria bacterium GWA2_38_16]|nr:MAG: hypothetical protein A2Z91_07185 [Deltaproteobacteria bacterium GWA2_38_16]OGQ02693.1 MAG: hypothetical protein A3D19_00520 [Deltaproteobacteria bacterium RIFCSPHIGHO2_02_FULL_38_15]OGQ32565.1 MAG: hypothetical protein A3A72_02875 [Deltaproteobacteria bacterium RIFCSPLOWO2_01_FULL_38_9]OGQ59037.1 MAG: hypothetical protein A3G92_05050 [Deltaproteobacteria bacterium RIFCSPLOWO2_12_FULL_38_8]HBQ20550.1 anti-sigma factor antagonist [Deltaproteobacteria bacterium]